MVKPKLSIAAFTDASSCFESHVKMSEIASFAVFPAPTKLNNSLICPSRILSTSTPSRLKAFMVSVNTAAMVVGETPLSRAISSKSKAYSESETCLANFLFSSYSFISLSSLRFGSSGKRLRKVFKYSSLT